MGAMMRALAVAAIVLCSCQLDTSPGQDNGVHQDSTEIPEAVDATEINCTICNDCHRAERWCER